MLKPFPWPAEKLSTNYCVGVGVEGMAKFWEDAKIKGDVLVGDLEEIDGVYSIDYGCPPESFIYFSVRSNVDNPATHTKILEVIKRFISDD